MAGNFAQFMTDEQLKTLYDFMDGQIVVWKDLKDVYETFELLRKEMIRRNLPLM